MPYGISPFRGQCMLCFEPERLAIDEELRGRAHNFVQTVPSLRLVTEMLAEGKRALGIRSGTACVYSGLLAMSKDIE